MQQSKDIAVYSVKYFEYKRLLDAARRHGISLRLLTEALSIETVHLSNHCSAVVIFAVDDALGPALCTLAAAGIRHIAIRAAGYDNVDVVAAHALGITLANVPAYSPYAIAEHAVALLLALDRKLIVADKQVHRYNFTVGSLVGFDLNGKTVGIIGAGNIGGVFAHIMRGFGCRLLAYDKVRNTTLETELGLQYCSLEELCAQSDVISLHVCLTPATKYLINEQRIREMKPGVIIVNTARGAVVNTADIISGLESGHIGAYGADVYEHEKGLFFYDRSQNVPKDSLLEKLLQMPNVLITPHQAFATNEALDNIAETTCYNLACWQNGGPSPNEL